MTPAGSCFMMAGCMFTSEIAMAARRGSMESPTFTKPPRGQLPRIETSIVPKDTVGGRALVAVVAIMTFLASLTSGAVLLVSASASEWQSEVAREVTVQVRPLAGRDIEVELRKAVEIVRSFPGIADLRPYSKEESSRLLDPWLGTGLILDDLPVPRIIAVKLTPGGGADLAALRKALTDQVAGASLDDHRGWIDHMRAMAGTAVAGGVLILILVFAATILSVIFATRGAMAANRTIIEVLYLIGAKHGFIAGQFQRHFLLLGLKGGIIGGGAAIALFALATVMANRFIATAGADQIAALFGTFSLGAEGYVVLILHIPVIAVVTAATSRQTVSQTLEVI